MWGFFYYKLNYYICSLIRNRYDYRLKKRDGLDNIR